MPNVPSPTDRRDLARRKRPFSLEEYHLLGRAGIPDEDDRIELLDGRLINASIASRIGSGGACTRVPVSPGAVQYREPRAAQRPLRTGAQHSAPSPGCPQGRTPIPGDVLLLIEMAASTRRFSSAGEVATSVMISPGS